jgi:hypothetical protein
MEPHCIAMLIVDIQDVQIHQIADPQAGELSILYHLNEVYILLKVFPLAEKVATTSFYQQMITERSWQCLVAKSNREYSVWVSRSVVTTSPSSKPHPELVFAAQMYLLQGISCEITELLGRGQNDSFERAILISLPTVRSVLELRQIGKVVVQQSEQSIKIYQPNDSQLHTIYQNLSTLADQYLGKKYALELVQDLMQQMPPPLVQALKSWLKP